MAAITRATVNNPELLRWARTTAGYELDQIAEYLGKAPEEINAWEEGEAYPTYRQLQKFANKVGRAVATLYLPHVPEEPPSPDDYRILPGSARGEFSPDALLAFRSMRAALADLQMLASVTGATMSLSLPQWCGLTKPVDRAAELREASGVSVSDQVGWRNAYHALDQWRSVFFDYGVLVQVFQIPIEDVRGFSLTDHGLAGIGLSSQDATAGRIFSMLHEVGHLCIGRPGVSGTGQVTKAPDTDAAAVERYCDQFAAALLLPAGAPEVEEAVRELADHFTTDTATRIARRFSVSRDVMARRVLEMGLVRPDVYWEVVEAWRSEGRRRNRSGDGANHVTVTASHRGKPFVRKVIEAIDAGVVSRYEGAEMLSLRPSHLPEARELTQSW